MKIKNLTYKDIGKWVFFKQTEYKCNEEISVGRIARWDEKYIYIIYRPRTGIGINDKSNYDFYSIIPVSENCVKFVGEKDYES